MRKLMIAALALVFALTMALFVKAPANAAQSEYYVSTNGSDSSPGTEAQPFKTLSKAAAVAKSGNTIYVKSGTYNERVTLGVSGTSAARIVFKRYGSDKVVVSKGFSVNGSYLTLDGFEINAMSTSFDDEEGAVSVKGNNNVFDNINIHDTMGGCGFEFAGSAAYNTVDNSQIVKVFFTGLIFDPNTNHNTIKNTKLNGFGGNFAIDLGGSYNTLDGMDISGPEKSNSSSYDGDGVRPSGDHNTVKNCKIHDIFVNHSGDHTDAIQWWDAISNFTIENNVIGSYKKGGYNNSPDPANAHIMIGTEGPTTNLIIRNNVFLGECLYPININTDGPYDIDMKFYNNVVWGGPIQIDCMPNAKIKNNIFMNGRFGEDDARADSDYNLYCNSKDKPSREKHSIVGNPKFVNPDVSSATGYGINADWHLQSTSPAINAGIGDAYVSTTDKDGSPREGAVDIGAYEYTASSNNTDGNSGSTVNTGSNGGTSDTGGTGGTSNTGNTGNTGSQADNYAGTNTGSETGTGTETSTGSENGTGINGSGSGNNAGNGGSAGGSNTPGTSANANNGSRASDTTPPSLSVNLADSKRGTVTTISAVTSDSSGIKRVEFYVNGKLVLKDTSSPYQYRWSHKKTMKYAVSIRVISYDKAGNKREVSKTYPQSEASAKTIISEDTPSVAPSIVSSGDSGSDHTIHNKSKFWQKQKLWSRNND
jgi:hypothetical protein